MYVVRSLLRKRKDDEFLVEWQGFPSNEATWENRKCIPKFIVKVNFFLYFDQLFSFDFSFMKTIPADLERLCLIQELSTAKMQGQVIRVVSNFT